MKLRILLVMVIFSALMAISVGTTLAREEDSRKIPDQACEHAADRIGGGGGKERLIRLNPIEHTPLADCDVRGGENF